MITFNGLPVFAVTLASDGDGVVRVSLVDDPAVRSNFDVFRAEAGKAPALYAVQDEDRHLVRGVVLRADYPIYRRDSGDDPGYYVTFSKEVIREIAEKYLADGRQNAVDTDHDGQEVDGVRMVQYFIKDAAAGIDPEGFEGIADGSLFAEYHVTNQDVWDEIKAGTFRGFSVEIFYTLIPGSARMGAEQAEAALAADTLTQIFSKIKNMSILKKIRAGLQRLLVEFGATTTDKGVLYWDGDEDLKAGDSVYTEDEEGNRSAAEDGDYVTADGKTIVVVDGKVSEIKDPEAEVAPEPTEEGDGEGSGEGSNEPAGLRRFKAVRAAFDESYEDRQRAIIAAIYADRGDDADWYLYEAGDDYAVICIWDETGESFLRYDVSWNEDGSASVSNPTKVELEFAPVGGSEAPAEDAPTEEEFAQAVRIAETYKAENTALKARIAALEKRPAAPSAHEAFKKGEAGVSTGDKGLDRLANRFRK